MCTNWRKLFGRGMGYITVQTLALAALSASAVGCARSDPKVSETIRSTSSQIRLLSTPDLRDIRRIQEYELPANQRALVLLEGKSDSDFDTPALYFAKIVRNPDDPPELLRVVIWFFESGFEADGFYVENARGRTLGGARGLQGHDF